MQNSIDRKVQSYRRVVDWSRTRDGVLQAAPVAVHAHFAALGEVITRIEANAVTQVAQHGLRTRVATDADVRRLAVRSAMRPIAQVARALQGTVFGIGTIADMPNPNWDNERLVIAANSMVENASTFNAVLVDHGLQSDCIETLQTAAAALKSSIDARGKARSMAVGARDAVRAGLKQGKKLVSLLDAGLTPLLKDPALLASWRNAKRITLKSVVGNIVPPAPTATAPSTTSPTSATTTTPTTRAA